MNICILEKPGKCLDQILGWLSESMGIQGIFAFENDVQFLEEIGTLKPDVCIIRVHLSDFNGLRTAEIIKQKSPDSRIVILSETKDYALEAFEIGAHGYLLCPLVKKKFLNTVFWTDGK